MSNITELNEENFQQEVLNSTTPVLVDFWAPWCGPCQRIAPVVEELAAENAGRLKVGKVNVDQSPQLAAEYGVNGIPTLMVFKNGEVIRSLIGLQPKARLQEAINAAFE
ncbi:MAG TPA: thioredoxin [Thermoguttaceae bacterium]|nr:thioredoxin [Thermoguttaceae bacterium]